MATLGGLIIVAGESSSVAWDIGSRWVLERVIGTGDAFSNSVYGDGTPNTAQHFVFRNVRVSDPRPQRTLLEFKGQSSNASFLGWAGLRFENVEYRHPNTWGKKNQILGTANGPARYWTFDDVSIGGVPMDAAMLADPARFETNNVFNMIFRVDHHQH